MSGNEDDYDQNQSYETDDVDCSYDENECPETKKDNEQRKRITQIENDFGVSRGPALLLLRKLNYDLSSDYNLIQKSLDQIYGTQASENQQGTCLQCKDGSAHVEKDVLQYHHEVCDSCWKHYLDTSSNQKFTLLKKCPLNKCIQAVDIDLFKKHLCEDSYKHFEDFLVEDYMERNQKVRECPKCDKMIMIDSSKGQLNSFGDALFNITCSCSYSHCSLCQEEAHKPLSCQDNKEWKKLIDKSTSQMKEQQLSKSELKRFTFNYERFSSHMKHVDSRIQNKQRIEEQICKFNTNIEKGLNFDFLISILQLLIEYRRVLSYCYPLDYFIHPLNRNLFEFNLQDLEKYLENLDHLFDTDIESYFNKDKTMMKLDEFLTFEKNVIQKAQLLKKYFNNMIHSLESEKSENSKYEAKSCKYQSENELSLFGQFEQDEKSDTHSTDQSSSPSRSITEFSGNQLQIEITV